MLSFGYLVEMSYQRHFNINYVYTVINSPQTVLWPVGIIYIYMSN